MMRNRQDYAIRDGVYFMPLFTVGTVALMYGWWGDFKFTAKPGLVVAPISDQALYVKEALLRLA